MEGLLTEKEYDVMNFFAVGMTDSDIAERSGISPNAVNGILASICRKINVPNRLQAMLWAGQNL